MERVTFEGAGVTLAADAAGPADGVPILFAHGAGQTRQSWGRALSEAERRGYRGVSLDLRGHGDSGWSPDGAYDIDRFVTDLRAVVLGLSDRPILVGASLGGIASMILAAAEPSLLRALVLVDIAPQVDPAGVEQILRFMRSAPEGFASLDDAADAVSAYLPHRKRPSDTSGLLRNLRLREGRYFWHWDPAFMRMSEDRGRAASGFLEEVATKLVVPTLMIRGGNSRVVSEQGLRAFTSLLPHAEHAVIAGADHMVAGDANDAFNEAVFAFVDRQLDEDAARVDSAADA